MSAPRYCECGRKIFLQPRKPSSWRCASSGTVKGHDVCRTCWDALRATAWAAQRYGYERTA